MDVTIVIPVYNQLDYTRQCLDSLNASGCDDAMIVVINNASTDGTLEYLAQRPRLNVIQNSVNRACAAAWNQGFHASKTNWILFLNNDVVLPSRWLEELVAFAEKEKVDIASPSLGEGDLDYPLEEYAATFMARMKRVRRRNCAHGACFLVRRKVFEVIGTFDERFRKGGNEDDDFFRRARSAGFKLAITGASHIHHFGCVTQLAIGKTTGSHRDETIKYYREKWKIGWVERRTTQILRKTTSFWRKWSEFLRHGHTLRERRKNGVRLYYG